MKLKPYQYKLLRFMFTGKKEGIDIKILLSCISPEVFQKSLDKFIETIYDEMNLLIAVTKNEKDFYFISKENIPENIKIL